MSAAGPGFTLPFDGIDPLPPDTAPATAEGIDVWLSSPLTGWMEIIIEAAGHTFEVSLSYAFDPCQEIILWLEAIARGEPGCVVADGEGRGCSYLYASEAGDPAEVRFTDICWREWEGTAPEPAGPREMRIAEDGWIHGYELMCDLRLPRRTFVAAFYGAFLERWASLDQERFWREWQLPGDEGWEAACYPIRSGALDAWLADRPAG